MGAVRSCERETVEADPLLWSWLFRQYNFPMKKAVPLKVLLRRLMKKADRALSVHIRHETGKGRNGMCPLCGKKKIKVCFHFITRRRKILRWREDNVIGACSTCNYVEQFYPDVSRAWFIRTYGAEKYLALVDESQQSFEPTVEYLQGIIDKYAEATK